MEVNSYGKCELVKKINGKEYVLERDYSRMVSEYTSKLREYEARNKNLKSEIEKQQSHIDCLQSELAELQLDKQDIPLKPIDVAAMLIKATVTCKTDSIQNALGFPDEYEVYRYSNEDLRQIAEHLLVYCNNAEEE